MAVSVCYWLVADPSEAVPPSSVEAAHATVLAPRSDSRPMVDTTSCCIHVSDSGSADRGYVSIDASRLRALTMECLCQLPPCSTEHPSEAVPPSSVEAAHATVLAPRSDSRPMVVRLLRWMVELPRLDARCCIHVSDSGSADRGYVSICSPQ
jgi:hypothetical protein